MKRRLSTIALFVSLGAALNVLVVAGVSSRQSPFGGTLVLVKHPYEQGLVWPTTVERLAHSLTRPNDLRVPTTFESTPGFGFSHVILTNRLTREEQRQRNIMPVLRPTSRERAPLSQREFDQIVLESRLDALTDPAHLYSHVAIGYPFASLKLESLHEYAGTIKNGNVSLAYQTLHLVDPLNVPLSFIGLNDFLMPVQPVPLGFIANTILYALLCWSALWTAGRWKHHRRTKRGLCTACAYDLTGNLTTCPECGTRVGTHDNPERQ